MARSRRRRHAAEALEILLTLVEHTNLPLVDAAWINDLLKRAAEGCMADKEFILFLKLSAWRKEDGAAVDTGTGNAILVHGSETEVVSEAPTVDATLFTKVMKNIQTCVKRGDGWQDEAAYGGLIAIIGDPRRLEPSLFDPGALQTFYEAMDHGNPFRVRQASYDIVLVTRNQWLKSEVLRPKLEELDFFRQLHRVVIEMARPDYHRLFLMMMDSLSEDTYWHSYLREAMDIWLSLRHEGTYHTLRIIANVGELSLPKWDGYSSSSFDDFLQKLIVNEWAAVPGRPVRDLTADRLDPLVEVTEQFRALLFDEGYRKAALAVVQRVIPGLEQRHDSSYEGPGEDVRAMIGTLMEKLKLPIPRSSRRQSTYWQ